jgi:hypothetical protein
LKRRSSSRSRKCAKKSRVCSALQRIDHGHVMIMRHDTPNILPTCGSLNDFSSAIVPLAVT